jgi:hypothetical protein
MRRAPEKKIKRISFFFMPLILRNKRVFFKVEFRMLFVRIKIERSIRMAEKIGWNCPGKKGGGL